MNNPSQCDRRRGSGIAMVVFIPLMCVTMFSGCDEGGYTRGRYHGFEYIWEPGTHVMFGSKLANVYIRTSDGQTFYLPDITPDNVADDIGWKETKLTIQGNQRLFSQEDSHFWFEGDSLQRFKLCSNQPPRSDPFLLGSNEGGPFVRMPRTKEELVALFGEPIDWAPYHPPTSP